MKYIFYTHSWVTQYIAERIILDNGMAYKDVVFIRNRNFNLYINPKLAAIPSYRAKKIILEKPKHLLVLNQQIRRIREWLSELTLNESFKLFVPHLKPYALKYLATHEQCKGVSFIEEGLLSYRFLEDIEERHDQTIPLESLFRVFAPSLLSRLKIKMFPSNNEGGYGIFPQAFPFLETQKNRIEFPSLKDADQEEIKELLVFAAYVSGNKRWAISEYLQKLPSALEFVENSSKGRVFFKFHPSDTKELKEKVRTLLLDRSVEFVELGEDVSLEQLVFSMKPKVFAFECSIALYAYLMKTEFVILDNLINTSYIPMQIGTIDLTNFYATEKG